MRSLAPLLRAMGKLSAEMASKLVLIGPEPHNELSLAASLGIEGQWFIESEPEDLSYFFRNDSFLELEIRRYF